MSVKIAQNCFSSPQGQNGPSLYTLPWPIPGLMIYTLDQPNYANSLEQNLFRHVSDMYLYVGGLRSTENIIQIV